jgi:hypothetical protein
MSALTQFADLSLDYKSLKERGARLIPFPVYGETECSTVEIISVPEEHHVTEKDDIFDVVLGEEIFNANPLLSSAVIRFCEQFELAEYFELVLGLLNSYFPTASDISVLVIEDPEIVDEKWIQIRFSVNDDGSFTDTYNKYSRELVSRIPWPERKMLRISYNIV